MNGVGDRCKAVLVLVKGEEPLQDDAYQHQRGYHCACSVRCPPTSSASQGDTVGHIKECVKGFCETKRLAVRFMGEADTTTEIIHGGMDHLFERIANPLTVVECNASLMAALRAKLLNTSDGSSRGEDDAFPYCLVAVLDTTHSRRFEPRGPSPEADQLGWLRPMQSYVSEYSREGHSTADAENPVTLFPLHMYCGMPMIRDTGYEGDGVTGLLAGGNVCTLEGILRELGYKAGQLPKYGA